MKIIPAIDIKDGKCVRLYQGDFAKTTEYSGDPLAVARRFSELEVHDLHIVDLDGARTGEQTNGVVVAEIAREIGLDVQLGGGIRAHGDVAGWLENGVTRCVVGSVAIREPETVIGWIDEFGADAIVLALDVRLSEDGLPVLTTHGWTESADVSLWSYLDGFAHAGIRHVLCTDVSRDGAMQGPNFDLYVDILNRYPKIRLQASGGVRDIHDLELLRELGVPAAITGRALLDGTISEEEITLFPRSE